MLSSDIIYMHKILMVSTATKQNWFLLICSQDWQCWCVKLVITGFLIVTIFTVNPVISSFNFKVD